jgi:Fe-S-cluster containining protein
MTKHFQCTACGKCCYGQLPLTWKDAFAHVEIFPLCFVWTPVQPSSKDFKLVSELGTTIRLPDRKELAVLIVPTSFIPSSFPCPALMDDGKLCSIHRDKPSRCKAMPFYPYREERYQAELLTPRQGWECDTSASAPIVFQDKKIVSRDDFEHEKHDLMEQVPLLRCYSDYMLKYTPSFPSSLMIASLKGKGGHVVTSLSSFLTATRNSDAKNIAQKQLPILNHYVAKTADDAKLIDFHKNYVNWAKEMTYLSQKMF